MDDARDVAFLDTRLLRLAGAIFGQARVLRAEIRVREWVVPSGILVPIAAMVPSGSLGGDGDADFSANSLRRNSNFMALAPGSG
jgi:hypothetical protein